MLVERALTAGSKDPAYAGREVDRVFSPGESAAPINVIAVGKAAVPMTRAAARMLGDRVGAGLVVAPTQAEVPAPFELIVGGHPIPTAQSEQAGRRALALARSTAADQRLLVLLSGGASALMAAPVMPVTLEDKQRTTERLLRGGADIHALNTVRKHVSAIKGGQLAAATRAPCLTLAISDVVGDDLSVIGSGPTVGDSTTFRDAYEVLRRFGGLDAYPSRVVAHLQRGLDGDLADTPSPDAASLQRDEARVIGGRTDAMEGAASAAAARGYDVRVIESPITGEARTAARDYARVVSERAHGRPRPTCVISSGETTVLVKGQGRGGRNQELALSLIGLQSVLGDAWLAASVGTDGVDGPTDAAGAIVDARTAGRARDLSLDALAYLDQNDSYHFFQALDDLIKTGPTGTNVGDLQVMLFL
jgi:hydroxypyruvate reductase